LKAPRDILKEKGIPLEELVVKYAKDLFGKTPQQLSAAERDAVALEIVAAAGRARTLLAVLVAARLAGPRSVLPSRVRSLPLARQSARSLVGYWVRSSPTRRMSKARCPSPRVHRPFRAVSLISGRSFAPCGQTLTEISNQCPQ
jgi:hypothetical protein